LIITNAGPLNAPNVTMTTTLSLSVVLQSATSSQGTIAANGSVLVGSFGTLGVGGLVTNSIIVTPQSAGTITNTATVTSGYTDPMSGNNFVSLRNTVLPLPVLSVRFVSPNGVRLSWPVQLTNFVLEYKTALVAGNFWSNSTSTPGISGGENVVIEPATSASRFYRLRK